MSSFSNDAGSMIGECAGARIEEFIVRLPFRIRVERQVEVRLFVELGFHSGRLADLVQLLAKADAKITDLKTDRSLYHLGMPERSAEVTFLAKGAQHEAEILEELSAKGFSIHEVKVR